MNEIKIPQNLTVIPATVNEASLVSCLFIQNQKALHCEDISLREWEELFSLDDPDEKHFLVCSGTIPIAYMKINGLLNMHEAWISMLFVARDFQNQGVGTFAICFAEKYIKERGFNSVAIQTDIDNLAAKRCYLKNGYKIFEQNTKIKFRKEL